MIVRSGIYTLVKENEFCKEAYDFNGSAEFLPRELVDKKVSLSTIDALTTLFSSSSEFEYLSSHDMSYGDMNAKTYIEYTRCNKTKTLNTVWKDEILNDIATDARGKNGGCININNTNAKIILHETFRKFEQDLAFYDAYLNSNAYYNINNHNFDLIDEIHDTGWKNRTNEKYFFERYVRNFTNYKEFREIYLLYKYYRDILSKMDNKEQKVYTLKRKNRTLNGQISMFE